MIGFIGAYTTFSTYMLESWASSRVGRGHPPCEPRRSVILGLLAVAAGLTLGRAL